MSSDNIDKRQISGPPHRESFFAQGEFVYNPDDPWPSPHSGMIIFRDGEWLLTLLPKSPSEEWFTAPLTAYKGQIGRHILIDNSGAGPTSSLLLSDIEINAPALPEPVQEPL